MDNPAGFYVNVHTTDFPGSPVRGQLAAAGGAGAPTTMPAAGASDGVTTLIFGLALLALLNGSIGSTIACMVCSGRGEPGRSKHPAK